MRPWTLALFALAGCYDWNVGPDAGATDAKRTKDAGVDVESHDSGHDVGVDARMADAHKADAPPHTDAGNPCPSLLATLGSSRRTSQTCTQGATPLDCQLSVVDPCGCKVCVRNAMAQSAFQAAVTAYANAGCEPVCEGETCSLALGTCLISEADGGEVTACYP